ncbi:MAG: protein kinase [Gemmataceae bacterium]
MVLFRCPHCSIRLQVKEGQYARCPLCHQVIPVPSPGAERNGTAVSIIPGISSNLIRLGYRGGVSLLHRPAQQPHGHGHGRYQVISELGRGGMGAILRVIDVDIRRDIAVKYLLHPNDAKKKARFIEEAQIAGQLEHPNIVPIHDFGVDAQNRLYFSMKLVKGQSLAQIVELQRKASPQEPVRSLVQLINALVSVCHAVAYAHSHGVVHRDLKPANIMVGDFGQVYVMDWGLAKVIDGQAAGNRPGPPAASDAAALHDPGATVDGTIVGTLAYMPPEQARGQIGAVDRRSDIYALGAILYEILTWQPPVDPSGGFRAVLVRVLKGEIVPPERLQPERARAGQIPAELSAIAMKALARDPAARYQTVEGFRRDLELFLEGHAVSAKDDSLWETLVKILRRNRGVSLAAGVGLVLLAAVVCVSVVVNYSARRQIEHEHNEYLREHQARRLMLEQSVPAFLLATDHALEQDRLKEARDLVELALTYQPDSLEALRTKGRVLIVQGKFVEAVDVLSRYLNARPDDMATQALLPLVKKASLEDPESLRPLIKLFESQDEEILKECLERARKRLLRPRR